MKTKALKTGFEFGAVQEIPEGCKMVYVVGSLDSLFFPVFFLYPKDGQIDPQLFVNGYVFSNKDDCRKYCLYLIDKHNDSNEE